MKRHELLAHLHTLVKPRTYLEVGVNDGSSLSLVRSPGIAIDPAFSVTKELKADIHLVRSTSDEFFARSQPLEHLPEPTIDLAFIDGMHLSEFALRDFINVERYTTPASVILLDDMLPRSVDEAARERHTRAWAGDVYKVSEVLRTHRPDLVVLEVDTQPTGTLLVLLPDSTSTVLTTAYGRLVTELVTGDPQPVPPEVLQRSRAVDPEALVCSRFWRLWSTLRDRLRPTSRSDIVDLLESGGLHRLAP